VCGYDAHVTLGSGAIGAEYAQRVTNIVGDLSGQCPSPLRLDSQQTKTILLVIAPPQAGVSGVYPVVPELTLVDLSANVTRTLDYSALMNRLVYANASQFACYALSGGAVAPDGRLAYDRDHHPLCI
jgi:hypothetical protein